MLSSMISPVKTEVQRITEYLSTQNPLPQYLPYARFLLSADLTHTAKLLYTLLLDRATLSQKNNWVDAKGRVYVLYPIIHLAKDLRCSTSSVTRALTELENADLLERLHTGFSKPSQILLKIPVGMQKCTSNQRNKNNLNDNHLIRANNTRLSFWGIPEYFSDGKGVQAAQSRLCRARHPDRAIVRLYPIHWQKVCRPCRNAAYLGETAAIREKDNTGYPGLHLCERRKPIKTIEKIWEQSVSSMPGNVADYQGDDGLFYCGKCHTPKEAFFAKGLVLMGKNKHPIECACHKTEREQQEAVVKEQKHLDLVRRLKADGFTDPAMLDWTFANDNGRSTQMHHAHRYVEQWQTMRSENIGLLLWGGVGTGKSFLAGCIANALMAQEVPVRMTNFAHILNELNNSFSGRNEVVDRLCRYPLLIIDDFGMERSTEYALEQIYNIVDSRYRSRKPLIVTTNLTLDEIRHPQDTAHARIYDRLLEMCVPISCIGVSFRKETAQEKLERLKELIG